MRRATKNTHVKQPLYARFFHFSMIITTLNAILKTTHRAVVHFCSANHLVPPFAVLSCRKILELEEELKVVGNNMKSLEISEQEVPRLTSHQIFCPRMPP